MKILTQFRTAAFMIILLTIITGLLYPLVVTVLAQLLFPGKANGSIIVKDGKTLGSELIGQPFSDPKYFWDRLSATGPFAYNAAASSGSNYGPINQAYLDGVNKRIQDLKAVDSSNIQPVPADLATASGSGLDPHISPGAALLQVERICEARHFDNSQKEKLLMKLKELTEPPQFMILGEERINVLILNIELDKI